MPTTGLRSWGRRFRLPVFLSLPILLSVASLSFAQNEEASWLPVIAKLASSLSQNDAVGALAAFDSRMKDYGSVESYINALVSQTDVLCAIDVVQDKQSGDARTLDVDWYMQLKSQAETGPTERRRERVEVRIAKIRGQWKITSVAPLSILAPIHIN